MKICITGCLGFIGTNVTASCLKEGWEVCGVDCMKYSANKSKLKEFKKHSNFSFIKKDINEIKKLDNYDYIINLAAETHVCNSIKNSNSFVESNINGVHNLLEIIRNSPKPPVFVHFSTDEVYGEMITGVCSEKTALCPSNPYSASKAAADMLVLAWNRTYKIPYIIVRPTNNYGAEQYPEKLIPKVCRHLLHNEKIPLHDGGKPIRNWLHVEDTARAIITLIKSSIKNEIFNISGDASLSNYKIVQRIIKIHNNGKIDKYVDTSQNRLGQDMRYGISSRKIRKIGWRPLKNIQEELPVVVSSYLKDIKLNVTKQNYSFGNRNIVVKSNT